jgi:hypothetical protein
VFITDNNQIWLGGHAVSPVNCTNLAGCRRHSLDTAQQSLFAHLMHIKAGQRRFALASR